MSTEKLSTSSRWMWKQPSSLKHIAPTSNWRECVEWKEPNKLHIAALQTQHLHINIQWVQSSGTTWRRSYCKCSRCSYKARLKWHGTLFHKGLYVCRFLFQSMENTHDSTISYLKTDTSWFNESNLMWPCLVGMKTCYVWNSLDMW